MTDEQRNYIVNIVSENILTPIIYMLEQEDSIDLICFCDRKITAQVLYNAEFKISEITGKHTEILDIREFSEFERLDIISRAKLIHAEYPMVEQIFAQSMAADLKIVMEERKSILERYKASGTCFLQ